MEEEFNMPLGRTLCFVCCGFVYLLVLGAFINNILKLSHCAIWDGYFLTKFLSNFFFKVECHPFGLEFYKSLSFSGDGAFSFAPFYQEFSIDTDLYEIFLFQFLKLEQLFSYLLLPHFESHHQ